MNPKKYSFILLAIIGILLALNIISYLNAYYNDLATDTFFYRKFNFDKEKNFPSIFSSSLHFISSILLFIIGYIHPKIRTKRYFWFSLSFLFLFLGLDELLRIHEAIGRSIDPFIERSGIFFYSWIIPYTILLIILAFLFIKPVLQLPRKTLINFIIAGVIFVGGAVGFEVITGLYVDYTNSENLVINFIPQVFVLYTIEELLEMIGITFFIYELLRIINIYKISE